MSHLFRLMSLSFVLLFAHTVYGIEYEGYVGRYPTLPGVIINTDNNLFTIQTEEGSVYEVVSMAEACNNPFGRGDNIYLQEVIGAVEKEMSKKVLMGHTSTGVFPETLQLAQKIKTLLGADKVISFQVTGTDAVRYAMNVTQQHYIYKKSKGEKVKNKVLVSRMSYHGSPDVSIGQNTRSEKYHEERKEAVIFPSYNPYFEREGLTEVEYVNQLKKQMEEVVALHGGKAHFIAIFIEPISGSSKACLPTSVEYMKMIKEFSKENELIFVSDEVMCGFGRAGTFSPSVEYDPDIIIWGKGTGGGFLSITSVAIRKGLLHPEYWPYHTHTHSGSSLLSVASFDRSIDMMQLLIGDQVIKRLEAQLKKDLQGLMEEFPFLHFQGVGAFWGGHFFKQRPTNKLNSLENLQRVERFTREKEIRLATHFKTYTLEEGVALYHTDTLDNGKGFMILPPLTISSEEVKRGMNALKKALKRIAEEIQGDLL